MSTREEQPEESKPVTYNIFILAMGVVLIIFGYLFTEVAKIQTEQAAAVATNTQIQVQLSQIQTDLAWVKERLSTSTSINTK
jgi:hypothetical protein